MNRRRPLDDNRSTITAPYAARKTKAREPAQVGAAWYPLRVREIYRSEYFLVTIDDDRPFLRRTRSSKPFSSLEEVQADYDAMFQSLDAIDRPRHVFLIDVRAAPPRNDPAFERVVVSYYPRLYGGFRALATIVRTQVGRLQVTRILQRFNFPIRVFLDEASAIEHLEKALATGTRQRDEDAARRVARGAR